MEITKNTSVNDLLSAEVDISTLLELLPVRNDFLGQKIDALTKHPYQNVMTIINLVKDNELIKAFEMLTGKNERIILNSNCQDFLCLSKWLNQQIEQIIGLLNSLSDDPDEEAVMLQASGVDKLEKYGEVLTYYNITTDPTKWEAIGQMPFSTIFAKLSIDKDMNSIQKNYANLMRKKKY